MVGFEKALGAVKVIKDQIQYRSQSLLNLATYFFTKLMTDLVFNSVISSYFKRENLIKYSFVRYSCL